MWVLELGAVGSGGCSQAGFGDGTCPPAAPAGLQEITLEPIFGGTGFFLSISRWSLRRERAGREEEEGSWQRGAGSPQPQHTLGRGQRCLGTIRVSWGKKAQEFLDIPLQSALCGGKDLPRVGIL